MKFILGKKLNMTQVWQDDECIPVTRIEVGPCPVTQIKNIENDGYNAIQIGFDVKKEKNIRKPQIGHLKKVKTLNKDIDTNIKFLREFRVDDDVVEKMNVGDVVEVDSFSAGDKIDLTSISKGKGFQGVVKRHGFKGAIKTHGTKDQLRMPGSIGATGPARVFKGVRMGGRDGGRQVTIKNLEIIDREEGGNVLLVRGGIPGAPNGLVAIKSKV